MNILIVTSVYPPNRSTASRRPHGLAHSLVKLGHRVTILSEKIPKNDPRYDFSFKPASHKRLNLKLIVSRQKNNFNSLILYLLDLFSPIRRPRKIYYALNKVIINRYKYDVIWATFPDHCSLAVAASLSKKLCIPWVADFRDCYQVKHRFRENFFLPIRMRSLKKVISTASIITSVASIVSKQIKLIKPKVPIILIENAFEKKDFLLRPLYKSRKNEVRFVFTGTIKSDEQSMIPLLDALLRNKRLDQFKIKIDLYGNISKKFVKLHKKHKLSKLLYFHGIVERKIALKNSMKADILLSGELMNSKIYDYIGAQKLILMTKSDFGNAERHIRENKIGWAPRNQIEMDKAINEIFDMSKKNKFPHIKKTIIKKFEYSDRAKKLNNVLNIVVKKIS